METLKKEYSLKDGPGLHRRFITTGDIYKELEKSMVDLKDFYSVQQLSLMLNQGIEHFGKTCKSRVNGSLKNGRWLLVDKDGIYT